MIYWDVLIFSSGLQLLIIIINLSFFETFMSSAVAVMLFVCHDVLHNSSCSSNLEISTSCL